MSHHTHWHDKDFLEKENEEKLERVHVRVDLILLISCTE